MFEQAGSTFRARRPRLGVNVDHVATLRQARGTRYPDPVEAATLAEHAGADQITVHLREDRRHIIDRDVRVLRETVKTRLNLEMAATDEMCRFALDVRPDEVTLVPERREERTTEGGLDVVASIKSIVPVIDALKGADIKVSLFIDPDRRQLDATAALEVPIVELHTGDYADAPDDATRQERLEKVRDAAAHGRQIGLEVAAGHGLNLRNVGPIAALENIAELNIGHAIVARAVFVGFERAVTEMLAAMRVRP